MASQDDSGQCQNEYRCQEGSERYPGQAGEVTTNGATAFHAFLLGMGMEQFQFVSMDNDSGPKAYHQAAKVAWPPGENRMSNK